MGKSWKTRSHLNTGYPYNPIRAAHLQVIRPKVRGDDEEGIYLGMYSEDHPVFSKAEFKVPSADLKRLEFLRVYSRYYVTKFASLYQTSRACLPSTAVAGLTSIETRVTRMSAPLVSGLQVGSERMLWNLDSKVDAIMKAANHALAMPDEQMALDLKTQELPDNQVAYAQRLEDAVQFVREHGIRESAKQAVIALLKRLDETKVPYQTAEALPLSSVVVNDAWGKLAAYPAVGRLLEQAQPSLEYTQRKYIDAHDAVVASEAYHRAVETAADVLQRVTETSLFKAAVERLYPAISGIADPALERIASSAYTQAVVQHLKPLPRGEAETLQGVSCMPC